MSDEVIVALIMAAATVGAQVVVAIRSKRATDAQFAVHEQKQEDALEEVKGDMNDVKRRLDIHNGYAEKIGSIEVNIAKIQKDVEYLGKDK